MDKDTTSYIQEYLTALKTCVNETQKKELFIVLLAQLFLLRERILNEEEIPLLSCADIIQLLEFYLPKRAMDEEELFRQLDARHRKRQADIDRRKEPPKSFPHPL